jgi:cytochrome b involved in lipid metabolism/fatty acid desaturase
MGKGGRSAVAIPSNKDLLTGDKQDVQQDDVSSEITKYSWSEVKKHTTPSDAWVVFQNKVYNVSNWHEHPGGGVIFTHAGDDMTDIFTAFHAPGSHSYMKQFYIGDLIPESIEHKNEWNIKFEKGYRELRSQLVVLGYFKASLWFYLYKCCFNLAMLASVFAMVYFSNSALVHFSSAVVLGLFWQQCGWLSHDFLHHQVFPKQRHLGNYVGLFFGNLLQGFSVTWWKNKHNGHHAVTNLHNSSAMAQDGDPDIDTMPVLAWSLKQAQSFRQMAADGKDSPFVRFAIKYQAFTYFPILLLARLSWLNESFKTAFGLGASTENAKLELERKGLAYPITERLLIILFHSWTIILSSGFFRFSIPYSIAYYLTATCSCGLFLALVFGLGHNGMPTYDADKRPDFWKLQVTTTRNIIGGHGFPQWFVDWFCGGLQYQVDHHLFPTMPRHNLAKAHKLVESFCKEWGVTYHEADLVDGTYEVLRHLSKVSDDFLVEMIQDFPAM